MIRFLSILLFAAGFSLALPAPTVSIAGPVLLKAAKFHLEDFQGQVVLLDFWASWCKPCQKSLPWLADMQLKYAGRGLQVVAVNLDQDLAAAADMIAALPDTLVLVHDPEGMLAQQFQLEGMPSAFIFGRDGQLAGSHVGFVEKDAAKRELELNQLLAKGTENADN